MENVGYLWGVTSQFVPPCTLWILFGHRGGIFREEIATGYSPKGGPHIFPVRL